MALLSALLMKPPYEHHSACGHAIAERGKYDVLDLERWYTGSHYG